MQGSRFFKIFKFVYFSHTQCRFFIFILSCRRPVDQIPPLQFWSLWKPLPHLLHNPRSRVPDPRGLTQEGVFIRRRGSGPHSISPQYISSMFISPQFFLVKQLLRRVWGGVSVFYANSNFEGLSLFLFHKNP